MPDPEVLSTAEVAERLGVSRERVRQLAASGALRAHRSSAGWLIPADALAERAAGARHGRPLAPRTAWALLHVLAHPAWAGPVSDRRLRHRVRRLLADLPDPREDADEWRRVLSARSRARRFWAHPGVRDDLSGDRRVSPAGPAALPDGAGLSETGVLTLYVRETDLDGVVADHALRGDPHGAVVVEVVPRDLEEPLAPVPGESVLEPVAAADLLGDANPRAREAGARLLRARWRAALDVISTTDEQRA